MLNSFPAVCGILFDIYVKHHARVKSHRKRSLAENSVVPPFLSATAECDSRSDHLLRRTRQFKNAISLTSFFYYGTL